MFFIKKSSASGTIKPMEVDEMAEVLGLVGMGEAKAAALDILGQAKGLVTLAKFLQQGADLEKAVKDLTAEKEALENAGKFKGEELAVQLKAKGDELAEVNRKLVKVKNDFAVLSAQLDEQLDTLEGKRANLDVEVRAEFDRRLRALDEKYQAKEDELAEIIDDMTVQYHDVKAKADAETKRLADVTAKIEALKAKL